jgi:prophage DNA circulation protein
MSLGREYKFDGKLGQCSFRGARFFWRDGGDGFGRRAVTHTYPLRNPVNTEDLGKEPGEFGLKGIVFGEGFLAQAAKVKEACNLPGAGVLVHPLWGSITVVCTECRSTYTTKKKGMVEFSFTFKEEGENLYPTANSDYAERAVAQAQASLEVFNSQFAQMVDLAGPDWLQTEFAKDLDATLSVIKKAMAPLIDPLGAAAEALDAAFNLTAQAISGAETIVDETLGQEAISTALGGLSAVASLDPAGAFKAALKITGSGIDSVLDPISSLTPSRLKQQINRQATAMLTSAQAIAAGVEAAMGIDYSSRQQAEAAMEDIVGMIDDAAIRASDIGDDQSFCALRDLMTVAVDGFTQIIQAQTPATQITVPAAATPALVLAYRLYGDISRESDILGRNQGVSDPAFMPSGDEVEVLSA